ncbi:NAD(P)-binding protein [Daldinia childiae]|uniref:NAD(P)-binding protein n=1 Tax=Daldinia childiae TaxID=326645 RepID=UPI0014485443|nr:NAD(P)-binding protein [Daldinia childiae]KAF3058042.1 NAD(P)-binding protein [Daldinia childiae]
MGIITSLFSLFGPGAALCAACEILAVIWPRVRLWMANDAPLTRFLHAARGKPAWAFVAGAGQEPIARELCFGLAARGFNIVLYGTGPGCRGGKVTMHRLLAFRAQLLRANPQNKYRVVVVDTDAQGDAVEGFVARVGGSLEGANLTLLIDCVGDAGGIVLPQLKAVLISLLKRNTPALIINVASSMPGSGYGTQPCYSHREYECLSQDGVNVVSCHIGDVAVGHKEKLLFHRSAQRALAETVLLHAASSSRSAIVYPYWSQAILQMTRKTLLGMAADQLLSATRGDVTKR